MEKGKEDTTRFNLPDISRWLPKLKNHQDWIHIVWVESTMTLMESESEEHRIGVVGVWIKRWRSLIGSPRIEVQHVTGESWHVYYLGIERSSLMASVSKYYWWMYKSKVKRYYAQENKWMLHQVLDVKGDDDLGTVSPKIKEKKSVRHPQETIIQGGLLNPGGSWVQWWGGHWTWLWWKDVQVQWWLLCLHLHLTERTWAAPEETCSELNRKPSFDEKGCSLSISWMGWVHSRQ